MENFGLPVHVSGWLGGDLIATLLDLLAHF